MEKIKDTLEKLWLNEKEIKIYLTSLSFGQSPASVLWEKHKIARSTANYTCQSLVDKWLMNVIQKWNMFLFSPENPEKLLSMINREYEHVEKKFQATRLIMDDLQSMINPERKLPKVKYFTWVDGLKEMFQDVLELWEDVRGFIDLSWDINQEILDYIKYDYIPKRYKKWMNAFSIFNDLDLSDGWKKNSQSKNREYKILGNEQYPLENCVQIYAGKVAFYSLKNDDLTGVIIENPYIFQTQLTLFQFIWDNIKES